MLADSPRGRGVSRALPIAERSTCPASVGTFGVALVDGSKTADRTDLPMSGWSSQWIDRLALCRVLLIRVYHAAFYMESDVTRCHVLLPRRSAVLLR